MNDIHDIALAKRFEECILRIPMFEKKFHENPIPYLKAIGIKDNPKWYEYTKSNGKMYAKHSGTPLDDFLNQYTYGKYIEISKSMGTRVIPDNVKMQNWRNKQIERCATMNPILHVPLVFELTSGCSVGCEFCGLATRKLESIYRATPQHIEVFEILLDTAIDIIGIAAAHGILYYGSEPLDNPDYEQFEEVIYKKGGVYPQMTTAVPLRDVNRTKKMLATINKYTHTFHRFSVRDINDLFRIYHEFTPEEMLYTIIEPRFKEIPGQLVSSGKMAAKTGIYGGTIACVSGFVVNMCNRTISLRSPCSATKKHPTGEIIYSTQTFRTLLDFSFIIRQMINDYM